jgi:hypothetical protein
MFDEKILGAWRRRNCKLKRGEMPQSIGRSRSVNIATAPQEDVTGFHRPTRSAVPNYFNQG